MKKKENNEMGNLREAMDNATEKANCFKKVDFYI